MNAPTVIFWIMVAVLLLGGLFAWLPDWMEKFQLPTEEEMERDLEDLL